MFGRGDGVPARPGLILQQIAGGDGFPTPEKVAIYGAEGARPYGNEKLGLHKIIKRFFIAHADGNAI